MERLYVIVCRSCKLLKWSGFWPTLYRKPANTLPGYGTQILRNVLVSLLNFLPILAGLFDVLVRTCVRCVSLGLRIVIFLRTVTAVCV